jgi:hypothetical protein
MYSFLRLLLAVLTLNFGVKAQTDFSVTTTSNYTWNQTEWSLTTTNFIPGQFQSRISLANGYVGASLAAAGEFMRALNFIISPRYHILLHLLLFET